MILNQFSLKGKIAIVTGASRGLGAGMALGLAEAGADVAVVATSAKAEETAKAVRELGRRAIAIRADLSSIQSIPGIVEKTMAEFGKIDILVNCAGINRRYAAIDCTEKEWDDVINLNQKSTYFMCQAVAREMIKQKSGKIINMASLMSFQGGLNVSPYTASKGAVAAVTKALANEWAPHGINVNAIVPGYFATDLTQALQDDPERNRDISLRIPQGRWGKADDLKGAVVFLASDASAYVQGHLLAVDGGYLAR
ncbi:MAG: kduD [Firmicutes bacterium]|nr:kduD [Bacillota bacterium]